MELALLFACRECGHGYHTEIARDRHEAKHTHFCDVLGNPDTNMAATLREFGLDLDDDSFLGSTTERERQECSACLRRRMCRMYAWGLIGIALFFCKECEEG